MAGIGQWTPIGADAEVVIDPFVIREGKVTARGRRGDVDEPRPACGDDLTDDRAGQRVGDEVLGQADHGCLLFDLAAAADDGQARRPLGPLQERRHLRLHRSREIGVARVVEVCEWEVVPHEDAQLVTDVEERGLLVRGSTAHPNHVAARVAGHAEQRPQLVRARHERGDVEGHHGAAPAEDGLTVDPQPEPAPIWAVIDVDGAHAGTTQVDVHRRSVSGIESQRQGMESGIAVGVRPPASEAAGRNGAGESDGRTVVGTLAHRRGERRGPFAKVDRSAGDDR